MSTGATISFVSTPNRESGNGIGGVLTNHLYGHLSEIDGGRTT